MQHRVSFVERNAKFHGEYCIGNTNLYQKYETQLSIIFVHFQMLSASPLGSVLG
jgi:hypothetical protein